jgi:hypothetical protein
MCYGENLGFHLASTAIGDATDRTNSPTENHVAKLKGNASSFARRMPMATPVVVVSA